MYVSGIFAKNEFANVAALCDIYDDRSRRHGSTPAPRFTRLQGLLASNVDAVLIATPAYLHPEHFEAAVKAKKHIFMEKPAAWTLPGASRVIDAAKKADPTKRISVDYQQRYGNDYRKAHEVVKSGELGAIKMIRAAWIGGGPADQVRPCRERGEGPQLVLLSRAVRRHHRRAGLPQHRRRELVHGHASGARHRLRQPADAHVWRHL